MTEKAKWLLSIMAGAIGAFSKQYGVLIVMVCTVIVMDWVTGVIAAAAVGEPITSQKGTKGFWKKMALLTALFFGFFLDYFVPYAIKAVGIHVDANVAVFGMVIGCYIVLNECISICENLYKTNPSIIPGWIVKLLSNAKGQIEQMHEDKEEE